MEKYKLCSQEHKYKWLEAIDVDAGGDLYFTDVQEGNLYRLKRNKDNTLTRGGEEWLLTGFDHAGGINIDRVNNDLYLGVVLQKKSKILKIPLAVFDETYQRPSKLDRLKEILKQISLEWGEFDINRLPSPKPNGVVFDPKTNNIFYTHEAFFQLGINGYVADAGNSKAWEYNSLNGLAIDSSSSKPVLVVSSFFRRKIIRLDLPELDKPKIQSSGFFPDGIFCLENGDMLVAAALAGKIYHLSWNGQSYGAPRIIDSKLDTPTDLVIAPSSSGKGESLFVTTTKISRLLLGGGGNIFEIPNIRELIKQN